VNVPIIERTKIQAEVLIPLVKMLQVELGEEQANRLVRKALGDLYREFGGKWWQTQSTHDLGETMATAFDAFTAGDALDYEVLEKSPNAFDVNVTGCRYAKFYREIGAPELGFLLVCSSDLPTAEGFGAKVQLTRTQTIMQGASHCDFRYRLEAGEKTSHEAG
jgi:hypothetical protein